MFESLLPVLSSAVGSAVSDPGGSMAAGPVRLGDVTTGAITGPTITINPGSPLGSFQISPVYLLGGAAVVLFLIALGRKRR